MSSFSADPDPTALRPGVRAARHLHVDWHRLTRRGLITGVVVLAVIELGKYFLGASYAADFHGGMWTAGRDVLAGHSPYPPPDASLLAARQTAFVTPPPLALLAIPFSALPFSVGAVLWTLASAAALAGALRLVGVRDLRVYTLAVCSFPFIETLGFGQTEGLLALAIAFAWHYRDSVLGALAVGSLIAAKLLAWPLVIWLLVTRRTRCALYASASAVALLFLSWACIGFNGFADYPRLLAADVRAFEASSFSVASVLAHVGIPAQASRIALLGACVVSVTVLLLTLRTDHACFTSMLGVGVLSSPILWVHYLVLLLIPLGISSRHLNRAWVLTCVLWLLPVHERSGLWQCGLVLATAIAVTAGAIRRDVAIRGAAHLAIAGPGSGGVSRV